jgi:outer membrane lipoprotein-sorting protein
MLRGKYIFLILAFLISSPAFAAEVQGQSILGEILRRMDSHNRSLQSLRSDVTMVKHNSQLNVADTMTGTTSYLPKTAKRGMYVRIDWIKPVEEQISVIGDDYELYRPRLNQVIVGKVQKARNNASVGGALAFMSMTRDQLRANYEVRYIGEEQIRGGVLTWRLEMTPKTETSYKLAELWVDGDGMPRQAKITEHNNDTTTVLLTNIQKNVTLKAEIFRLKYPSNVRKIRA